MTDTVVGIDIGGTSVRAVALDLENNEVKDQLTASSSDNGPELIRILSSVVKELEKRSKNDFSAIGLGVAGLANKSGVVRYSPNLPNLIEFPIGHELEKKLGIRVSVGNDATVATIAEWKIGAGRTSDNFVLATLGTGIGTGFVVDGHLLLGSNGFAGEAGHMTINANGPVHVTGQKGPWEYYASGNALNRIVQKEAAEGNFNWAVEEAGSWEEVTSHHLSSAVKNQEPDSLRILDYFCQEVSTGLTNLILLLDLDTVVISGGVCEIGEPLRHGIETWVQNILIGNKHRPKIEVKLAELGADSGAIGAALSTQE